MSSKDRIALDAMGRVKRGEMAVVAAAGLPGRRVLVRELSDGRLLLDYQGRRLGFTEVPARPTPPKAKAKRLVVNHRRYKSAADHPWNRGPAVGA